MMSPIPVWTFFHSIEYMRGRMPYGQFDTLYPPLANLFFYVLYLLVPKTQSDTWTESVYLVLST